MSDNSELEFVFVARVDDVPAGKNRCFEVEGRGVLLCAFQDGMKALENMCSHEKKVMEGGRLRGASKIVCPHHGSNFDLNQDGKSLGAPAVLPVTVFPVKVEDGNVYVQLVEAKKPPANPWAIPGVNTNI